MQDDWEAAVNAVLKDLEPAFSAQRADITAQVSAVAQADDMSALDSITVDEQAVYEVLAPALLAAAQQAAQAQQREAEDQGVTVPDWTLTPDSVTAAAGRDLLESIARVTARLMATSLVQSAVRTALRLFGHGNAPAQVTAGVQQHLDDLTDAQSRDAVGGAVTQAQGEGRRTVLAVAPPGRYFASEVLDRNNCKPCRDIDGTEYATLALSLVAYPSGGYRRCLGGSRCRGTIVTVWGEPAGATASAAVDEGVTMAYEVAENYPECDAGTPWAVVNGENNETMGCYATQAEADAQAAALTDADEHPVGDAPESMDYAANTAPWTGPLAVEGIVTGDGREFAPGSLTWADLPVPLRWNKEDSHGGEPHTVAVNVGRIDEVWRDGEKIMGKGVLNLGEPDGQRAYDLIKGKFLRGVSIDADSIGDADVELVWPEDDGSEVDDSDPLAALFGGPPPEKMIFHGGRIRAATLVDIPAFAEAYVALTDEAGAVVAGGQPYVFAAVAVHHTATSDAPWDAGANEKNLPSPLTLAQARGAYAWTDDAAEADGELPKTACKFLHHDVSADGSAGAANLAACSAAIGALHGARGGTSIPDADRRGVYDHVTAHLKDAGQSPAPFQAAGEAVTAAVSMADYRPHPSRFVDPGLAGYTGVVVTDDGYLYGHVAPWNACHIGYDGQCVTAPREATHDHFMTGEVVCSDGDRVQVGQVTIGTGHAPLSMGSRPAAEHYDNTGTCVADVAVGNDKHGIWVAGQIRPGSDPAAVFALRAAGRVSGDWRSIGGKLRLVALLGVNTAGFLQSDLRTRARVAGGQPMALVAAGAMPAVWHPEVTDEPMDVKRAYRVIMDSIHARVTEGR